MRRKVDAGWRSNKREKGNRSPEKSKLLIAPQSFKSWMKNPNSITALSLSWPIIARSVAQSEFEGLTSALQSNPKLKSTVPKALFWITPQTFKRHSTPRPNGAFHFSYHLIADGLAADLLPWVARSKGFMSFDKALARDRLPRVFTVFPHSGDWP